MTFSIITWIGLISGILILFGGVKAKSKVLIATSMLPLAIAITKMVVLVKTLTH